MTRLQDLEKKAKEDFRELEKAARVRIFGYLTAGLGFVGGLAWNDAIISLINEIFPSARNTIFAKFTYAIVLTLIIAAVVSYVERLLRKSDSGQDGKR